MPDDGYPTAHLERELAYYRRECNDLGARVLRLQEEQSLAFREARRSRTVVKLLREAYRLGDVSTSGADVGGPMLEIVVDNAMCDRAALLREEPIGSGVFAPAHLIGLPPAMTSQLFSVRQPPPFAFTSAHGSNSVASDDLTAIMGVPYVLWAFDRASGMALLIGNRSEGNVNRPFEPGDQELIESALSVYLDVIYRKQAEVQLRVAKQTAELASSTRSALLETLAIEMRTPLQSIAQTFAAVRDELSIDAMPPSILDRVDELSEQTSYLLGLVEDATQIAAGQDAEPVLDVEWVPVDELVRGALRASYVASVRRGIDLDVSVPKRRTTVCVDRRRMQHVLQYLVSGAMRITPDGGAVRIQSERRSDGSLELLIKSGATSRPYLDDEIGPAALSEPLPVGTVQQIGSGLPITRRVIEAHGGVLSLESTARDAVHARIVLPPRATRDEAQR